MTSVNSRPTPPRPPPPAATVCMCKHKRRATWDKYIKQGERATPMCYRRQRGLQPSPATLISPSNHTSRCDCAAAARCQKTNRFQGRAPGNSVHVHVTKDGSFVELKKKKKKKKLQEDSILTHPSIYRIAANLILAESLSWKCIPSKPWWGRRPVNILLHKQRFILPSTPQWNPMNN